MVSTASDTARVGGATRSLVSRMCHRVKGSGRAGRESRIPVGCRAGADPPSTAHSGWVRGATDGPGSWRYGRHPGPDPIRGRWIDSFIIHALTGTSGMPSASQSVSQNGAFSSLDHQPPGPLCAFEFGSVQRSRPKAAGFWYRRSFRARWLGAGSLSITASVRASLSKSPVNHTIGRLSTGYPGTLSQRPTTLWGLLSTGPLDQAVNTHDQGVTTQHDRSFHTCIDCHRRQRSGNCHPRGGGDTQLAQPPEGRRSLGLIEV